MNQSDAFNTRIDQLLAVNMGADADHYVSSVEAHTQSRELLKEFWRRRPDLNRGWRFCRPLPYHLATAPLGMLL